MQPMVTPKSDCLHQTPRMVYRTLACQTIGAFAQIIILWWLSIYRIQLHIGPHKHTHARTHTNTFDPALWPHPNPRDYDLNKLELALPDHDFIWVTAFLVKLVWVSGFWGFFLKKTKDFIWFEPLKINIIFFSVILCYSLYRYTCKEFLQFPFWFMCQQFRNMASQN